MIIEMIGKKLLLTLIFDDDSLLIFMLDVLSKSFFLGAWHVDETMKSFRKVKLGGRKVGTFRYYQNESTFLTSR